MEKFGVCLIQADVKDTIPQTVENAVILIRKAVAQHNPKIVVLAECFFSSYDVKTFPEIAEPIPDGYTSTALRNVAKDLKIYVVAGIIERDVKDPSVLYNSSPVFGPDGELIARHRKAHLCDINREDIQLDEVSYLKPGNDVTIFEVEGVKVGVAICYDGWFQEFINLYGKLGCKLMIFPNAYSEQVGESSWKLVHRARAVDNQLYVAAVSSARNPKRSFAAYGHSMVVDAYGEVIAEADSGEEIVFCEIDLKALEKQRKGLPLHTSRRPDIYKRKEFANLY